MTDKTCFGSWYRRAACSQACIGGALRAHRIRAFLFQEQQRAMIGILGEHYDALWLRLQAMHLPRPTVFASDLARIVAYVQQATQVTAEIDLERLEEIIRAGLNEQ